MPCLACTLCGTQLAVIINKASFVRVMRRPAGSALSRIERRLRRARAGGGRAIAKRFEGLSSLSCELSVTGRIMRRKSLRPRTDGFYFLYF